MAELAGWCGNCGSVAASFVVIIPEIPFASLYRRVLSIVLLPDLLLRFILFARLYLPEFGFVYLCLAI